jgi:putative ribosome biogenesis GTPase RsgA
MPTLIALQLPRSNNISRPAFQQNNDGLLVVFSINGQFFMIIINMVNYNPANYSLNVMICAIKTVSINKHAPIT